MLLTPMRYKNYIWPHNPRVYSISYERKIAVHKVPFGRYCTQDLGMSCRVMRGQGEFAGPDAYEEFKRLATVFYGGGPGLLIHPLWQISNAYFTELRLEQEPSPDYVRYSFTFVERFDGYHESLRELSPGGDGSAPSPHDVPRKPSGTVHIVVPGDTLWAIAKRNHISLQKLLAANPQIRNPNLIFPGSKVVIPC